MLELLETLAGGAVLIAYLGVAVFVPVGVVVLFVRLIGILLAAGLDALLGALPEAVRAQPVLAGVGRRVRGVLIWSVGTALFLALIGTSSTVEADNLVASGFAQAIVTLTAIQDIVAVWFTGRVLNDMLVELQPAPGEPAIVSLRLLQSQVAVHLYAVFQPGVTQLAFRWTFAALAVAVAGFYVVLEPLRAVRRRIAQLIAPPAPVVQALARATPAAPPAVAPAPPVSAWARPGAARAPAAAPAAAPGAVASQRVAVVTWDGELAAELERQLDGAGFAPIAMRSVAEAFASRVWPAIVFIDARHLQWLSPDRLPLAVRARLVAVTRDDLRVPAGWQLDTHAVEAGGDALLDLLRRRDARRRAGGREA